MTPPRPHRTLALRLAMLLCLAWLLSPAAAMALTMVSIDRPSVNMRSGAGTRHAVAWQLARGYPLKVIGRQAGWLHVSDFENDRGWVLARLTARKPHVIVKASVVNLRQGPGTRHRRIGRAEYGEVLRTLAHRKGWVRVRQEGGRTGWVSRRLVWGW